MRPSRKEILPENVREFSLLLFKQLEGAMVSFMVCLGDRLGLYRAMQGAGPLTSEELAARTGLSERWLREWLRNQAAAGLVEYEGEGKFELSPVAAFVLADEGSPAFAAGGFMQLPLFARILERLPEAFRTGIGFTYDAAGPEGAHGVERLLAPWFRTMLVPVALPALEGVVEKLERGAKVADVGCGAGVALIEMAKAFPQSEYHGYDPSRHAIERARENAKAAGLSNVFFHQAGGEALPPDGRFDLVTTFDCLHDMTDPMGVMRAIRRAIREDGTWLIADINAKPTFEENLQKNPLCAMMYGFSIVSCMASALSEPGGAGLGTLGLSEPLLRDMTREAGFTRFRRHDFQNPVNAYYEVRP